MDRGAWVECVEGWLDDCPELDVVAGRLELVLPGGFDLADVVEGLADEGSSFFGEEDDAGASVAGVGSAFEVSGVLEDVDELAH